MNKKGFDFIIIGAGIGGLVLGCMLARARRKVLILEKNSNVGGCCSSFTARGHIFDSFAHSLGALRGNSPFQGLLRDLDLLDKFEYEVKDPPDIVHTPEYKVRFYRNLDRTVEEIGLIFKLEKDNLYRFFLFLVESNPLDNFHLRKVSFKTVIDKYIKNEKLKSILQVSLFGNSGLPSSKINAFLAYRLYQEFLIDGGCSPKGGMQKFADLLAAQFESFGGEIRKSSYVKKIHTVNKEAQGVITKNDELIEGEIIISNSDMVSTYRNLLKHEDLNVNCRLDELQPSLSIFLNYYATSNNTTNISEELNSTNWIIDNYDLEHIYYQTLNNEIRKPLLFLIHNNPDNKGFTIEMLVTFANQNYWKLTKNELAACLLINASRVYPGIDKNIKFRLITTPDVIKTWTNNSFGSAYGWAGLVNQYSLPEFTYRSEIKGLFFTGHWTTLGFGVTGVSMMAKSISKRLLNSINRRGEK